MKQIVSMILCFVLAFGMLPLGVFAREAAPLSDGTETAERAEIHVPEQKSTENMHMQTPFYTGSFRYKVMSSSQAIVDLIKDAEGFVSKPMWDYSQWSIGYGTSCGYDPSGKDVPAGYWNGISEKKGEELLRNHLENSSERSVNSFFSEIGRQPTQQQFDAMVDFTYALGGSWTSGSMVADYLKNPMPEEMEFMRALGAWCRVDGEVWSALCSRRIREALIYCYGYYTIPRGNIDSSVAVVPDDKLPMFHYVIYEGNGSSIVNERTDEVNYYMEGSKYSNLLRPKRSGYVFSGWKVRDSEQYLMEGQTVKKNVVVYAQWSKPRFKDVDANAWYAPSIAYCYDNGIMQGLEKDLFGPNEGSTRGMIVTVLYRMAGQPPVTEDTGLADIDGTRKYYTDAVKWAVKNNVATGYKEGLFKPNQKVNRAELVTFLYRFARNIKGADVTGSDSVRQYEDMALIPDYAIDCFNWALGCGIISGTSTEANLLSPRDLAVRAQMAKMLMCVDNLEDVIF